MKRPIFNSLLILLPLLPLPLANGQPSLPGGWLPIPDTHTGRTQTVATVRTSPFNETQFAGITPPDDRLQECRPTNNTQNFHQDTTQNLIQGPILNPWPINPNYHETEITLPDDNYTYDAPHYIPGPIITHDDPRPFNHIDRPPANIRPREKQASTHPAFAFDPFQEYRPTNDTQGFHQETTRNLTQSSSSNAPFINRPNLALNGNQALYPVTHWRLERGSQQWTVYDEHLQATPPNSTSSRGPSRNVPSLDLIINTHEKPPAFSSPQAPKKFTNRETFNGQKTRDTRLSPKPIAPKPSPLRYETVRTHQQDGLHQSFQSYVNSQARRIQEFSNTPSTLNQATLIQIIAETCLTIRLLHAPLTQETSKILKLEEAYINHLINMDWKALTQVFAGIPKLKATIAYIRGWQPIPDFRAPGLHFRIQFPPLNCYNFNVNSYRLSQAGIEQINSLILPLTSSTIDKENDEA